MRDAAAAIVAIVLLIAAIRLTGTLQGFRRRRQRAQDSERALGRRVIAEIPAADDLVLVSEDDQRFYYGDRSIDKDVIVTVRVLINGVPIATCVSPRRKAEALLATPTTFDDRPEGIARDRWDVAVETLAGTTLIECGAIRERVSQELARAVFDAMRRAVEGEDHHSVSSDPAR